MSSVTSDARDHESVSEAVRVEHGDDGPSPSHAVVEALAGVVGVDPTDLADEAGICLYDHVDLDAVDELAAGHRGADLRVSFSVGDFEISVGSSAVVAERAR